ncbi:putative uncharacterized protein ANP32CP [Procambarus clarkii]|uniref:putative uncharacterized protein ANP32CP n=1 Tax=Procambarus clarkii TaxID=6728 RepID=UPI003743B2AB
MELKIVTKGQEVRERRLDYRRGDYRIIRDYLGEMQWEEELRGKTVQDTSTTEVVEDEQASGDEEEEDDETEEEDVAKEEEEEEEEAEHKRGAGEAHQIRETKPVQTAKKKGQQKKQPERSPYPLRNTKH